MSGSTPNWVEGYNAQKAAEEKYIKPLRSKSKAKSNSDDRESLNRLQLMLVWLASILIAVTIYSQIVMYFG